MTRPDGNFLYVLLVVALLSGCTHLGIRPNEPPTETSVSACDAYTSYSTYAQNLQEAYHSRASQNRGWLYVAGLVALGVAAASGGLAVAGAAAGTLGLLAIGGGFAAGSFATINNDALSASYTVAANHVDQALAQARAMLTFADPDDKKRGYTGASCEAALRALVPGVSDARIHLEVARTDNAAGALARAKDQRDLLNQQFAAIESADITHVTLSAAITAISPPEPKSTQPPAPTPVTITVKNINLSKIGLDEIKVALGSKELAADAIARPEPLNDPTTYVITFTAPATQPDPDKQKYSPILIVQGKARVADKGGHEFAYPSLNK